MGANKDMLDSMVDAKVALDYIEKQASAKKIDPKKMAELLKNFYKDQKKWIAMSTAVGAVGNGIRGAFSEKKEKDGKVHRVKNALKGAAQGATVGLGTGITTSAFHYGDNNKTALETLDDMCMEKEAAIWGTIAKGATSLLGKAKPIVSKTTSTLANGVKPMINKGTELASKGINAAKPTFYKSVNKVGNAFGVKNASGQMNNFFKNHGSSMAQGAKLGAGIGAVGGAVKGLMNGEKDENGKTHRFKNMLSGAAQGAAGGAMIGGGVGTYGSIKSASEMLDEMYMEKEAGIKDMAGDAFKKIKDTGKAYGYVLSGKNISESKRRNEFHKKLKQDIVDAVDKSVQDKSVYRPFLEQTRAEAANIPSGADKKEYFKTIGAYAAPVAALTAVGLGVKKLRDRKKEKEEKTASELLDEMCFEKEAAMTKEEMSSKFKGIGVDKHRHNYEELISTLRKLDDLENRARKSQKFLEDSAKIIEREVAKEQAARRSARIGKIKKTAPLVAGGTLLASGAVYGAKKLRDRKKEKEEKTASELLDEMCIEKEAAIAGTTTAAGGVMGAIKGATKGFATGGAKGAIVGALNGGAKGAMAGGIAGGLVDGVSANVKDANDPNKAYQ